MEQFVLEFLGSASGLGAYGLVFGVLVACGLGLPLPEDVALITGGYLAFLGHANLHVMLVVGFLGILVGDTIVFHLGRASRRAHGRQSPGGMLKRHITPERLARVEAQFNRRGPLMVVVARFLPGVRAATYFVAGGARMTYARFILYDGLAALISAPLFVFAGHHFGGEIGQLVEWAKEFHNWLIGGMVAIAGLYLAWQMAQRRRAARAPALVPAPALPPLAAGLPKDSVRKAEARGAEKRLSP